MASNDDPAAVAMWLDDWFTDVWIAPRRRRVPLLFPDGRLPSRALAAGGWFATGTFAVAILACAFGDRSSDTLAPGTVR